jgi:6-phosphofructokinase 1
VTDEFLAYARPLIGDDWVSVPLVDGLARFARVNTKALAPRRLPEYVPQTYRKEG